MYFNLGSDSQQKWEIYIRCIVKDQIIFRPPPRSCHLTTSVDQDPLTTSRAKYELLVVEHFSSLLYSGIAAVDLPQGDRISELPSEN